ncbi:hypothetical protein OT109_12040 [Phycisphaeraceae bacterium D3-23]
MTRQEMYRQCRMTNANRATVGFIPASVAVVGRVLKLEMPHGMEDGWRVESVGQPIAKDTMRLFERQHKKQRSASDMGTKTRRGRARRA